MSDLVSIIMPSYNTGRFISETIQSVLAQSYIDWELIIVDDCSTDNTDDVVSKYLVDNRIRYIKNDINSGAALSRNRALREAKGRWIAFLDSDDLWEPKKLEKQISFMQKHGYAFSYTRYTQIDENGESLHKGIYGPKKITKNKMYLCCWPGCLTVMYDAKKIGLISIKNLRKNNDYPMWLKIVEKSDCYLLDENLAKYRKRSMSISKHGRSHFERLKWYFLCFREGMDKGIVCSAILSLSNVFFGLIKKVAYERKEG